MSYDACGTTESIVDASGVASTRRIGRFFVITDVANRVGGDKYIGVNMETGETKSFGNMGD